MSAAWDVSFLERRVRHGGRGQHTQGWVVSAYLLRISAAWDAMFFERRARHRGSRATKKRAGVLGFWRNACHTVVKSNKQEGV